MTTNGTANRLPAEDFDTYIDAKVSKRVSAQAVEMAKLLGREASKKIEATFKDLYAQTPQAELVEAMAGLTAEVRELVAEMKRPKTKRILKDEDGRPEAIVEE